MASRVLSLALWALIGLAAIPSQALALQWVQVESPHFIVYGDVSEKQTRDYALMLEDFNSLMRALHGEPRTEATTHKLNVYLLDSDSQLRAAWPTRGENVVGLYIASEEEIFDLVTRRANSEGHDANKGDDTALHEYVHHFMMQYFPGAWPSWLSEGLAEYYMTADLSKTILVGGWNSERAFDLANENWVPLSDLLSKGPLELPPDQGSLYYAEAFALTHFYFSDPDRKRKLSAYLAQTQKGVESLAAWRATIGDPKDTEAQLHKYLQGPMMGQVIQRTWSAPAVTTTTLTPGEGSVLLLSLALHDQDQIPPEGQAKVLRQIREAETRYPQDAAVRLVRAKAELLMGDKDLGARLLDQLISENPVNVQARLERAEGEIRDAEAKTDQAQAKDTAANALLAQVLKLDPNNFRAYYLYARARVFEPGYPTENTYNAALRAVDLAPQVDELRLLAASMAINRKDLGVAREMLIPIAAEPHGDKAAAAARKLLKSLPDPSAR